MPSYLAEIIDAHRAASRKDGRSLDELVAQTRVLPATRGFRAALVSGANEGLGVIAEVKRRSPSKGSIAEDLDPGIVATDYEAGGATALSVLTDTNYFGGSTEDLAAARRATTIPVLRKDFTVCAHDVVDARLMGADAVLLIVAALSDAELLEFALLAKEVGLDALVEVHDRAELERALVLGTGLVGVNQRNLETFDVDGRKAEELAARIPSAVVAVAESGIEGPEDARRLADAGYQAVLVGESLVRSPDRRAAVASLRGSVIAPRGRTGAAPSR
jgi:indole-3-glycerol phosphate synthase